VLATGMGAVDLLAPHGLSLPLTATRAQIAFFERPAALGQGPVGHVTMIDRAYGYYARPQADGLTLVGLSAFHEPVGAADPFATVNDPGFAALAHRQITRRIPAMATSGHVRGHTGPLDVTPDGCAILDRAPGLEGVYLAVGMSGTGFKKSPAIGTCMAELITTGQTTTAPIDAFALDRFTDGSPIVRDDYALPADVLVSHQSDTEPRRGLIH